MKTLRKLFTSLSRNKKQVKPQPQTIFDALDANLAAGRLVWTLPEVVR